MKSDSLFYKYFQLLPEALLLLAGEPITEKSSAYRFQSVEIKDLSFRLDGVLALADFHDTFFFVEVQYQKDATLYERIFAEIMVFLYQHQPQGYWRVVVIFPKRSIDAGVPDAYREYLASGRLKIVYLNELPQEALADFPLNIVQLLNAPKQKEIIADTVQKVLSSPMSKKKRSNVTRLLHGIISAILPNLSFEEIKAMVEPTLSGLEKTRYYRDLKAMEKKNMEQGAHAKQIAIAQNLLAEGLEIKMIARVTGLSIKAVKALQHS